MTGTSDFAAFVASLGLLPKQPPQPDGRWRRCGTQRRPKSDNGAYKLLGQIGWAYDLSSDSHPVRWQANGGSGPLPPLDLDALRNAESEHRRMAEAARAEAWAYWSRCRAYAHPHPYIEKKGLDALGCSGFRIDRDGWLVVPAWGPAGEKGGLRTVQRISPEGDKRFWPGAPVGGSGHRIRHYNRTTTLTVLCEGVATGLAIYQAVPFAQVIVCWDAGNLAKTAHYVSGLVCIAADNDHETEAELGRNPGLDAARAAAERIGCGIAVPPALPGCSDWQDVMAADYAARLAKRYNERPSIGERRLSTAGAIRAAMLRAAKPVPSRRNTAPHSLGTNP